MRQNLNTLYVMNQEAHLRRDHETLVVEIAGVKQMQVPRHHIRSLVLFGHILVTPGVLQWCTEAGISVTYLDFRGRFVCRMEGPVSGNVLLRLDQYKAQQSRTVAFALARDIVAGKIYNLRANLLRSARDGASTDQDVQLRAAADTLAHTLKDLAAAEQIEQVRGIEGEAGNLYFGAFSAMLRCSPQTFHFAGRNRRPPRDPVNALLSFVYALLNHECRTALEGVGLDPQIGFLHVPRPGRPSLALDLMEEFRPILADRLVLTLINRQQVRPNDFEEQTGGSIQMQEKARRTVIEAWQALKQRTIRHPLLEQEMTWMEVPHVQARLLARTIRGELEHYPAFQYR